MLKINLLPAYIYERRRVRAAMVGFGVLAAALLVLMIAWSMQLHARSGQLARDLTDMEAKATQVQKIKSDAEAEKAKIPPIEARNKFIEAVMEYNKQVPALYEELAKYTYSRIVYQSVQVSGSSLTVQAHARSVGDCGRYLLNMYRARHLFSSVSISSVPGWPSGGGSGGAAGAPGGPMPGGAPGGVPPGVRTAMGMPGPGAPGAPPMPGGPGMPGMAGPQASSGSSEPGFDFTVTCALVKPIVAPSYATGSTATAGAPGASGAPGMPGPAGPGGAPGMPGPGGPPR
ncbi:MAG: PilN domain-containing protein [Armatimonadota bacterium]